MISASTHVPWIHIYLSHEFPVLLSVNLSGLSLIYWTPAVCICIWWLLLPYNWCDTDLTWETITCTANIYWFYTKCTESWLHQILRWNRRGQLHCWAVILPKRSNYDFMMISVVLSRSWILLNIFTWFEIDMIGHMTHTIERKQW